MIDSDYDSNTMQRMAVLSEKRVIKFWLKSEHNTYDVEFISAVEHTFPNN